MTESVSMEAVLEMRDYIRQLEQKLAEAEKQVTYTGNGTAGREADVKPTGFFFQMPKANKQEPVIDKSAAVRIATALGWEPQRQPLTDEHIELLWREISPYGNPNDFAKAIEAAHGIKGEA